jgi:hypothetical protein
MRRFPDLAAFFKIAAAAEMLADGPRLFHSVANDFAKARTPQRSQPERLALSDIL